MSESFVFSVLDEFSPTAVQRTSGQINYTNLYLIVQSTFYFTFCRFNDTSHMEAKDLIILC